MWDWEEGRKRKEGLERQTEKKSWVETGLKIIEVTKDGRDGNNQKREKGYKRPRTYEFLMQIQKSVNNKKGVLRNNQAQELCI